MDTIVWQFKSSSIDNEFSLDIFHLQLAISLFLFALPGQKLSWRHNNPSSCKWRHSRENYINDLLIQWWVQMSISSTFYACLFCTKVFEQLFFDLLFGFEFLAPIFCTKNARVKRWWNWLPTGRHDNSGFATKLDFQVFVGEVVY